MSDSSSNTPEKVQPLLPASNLSAADIKQALDSVPLNKENAIKMITMANLLKKAAEKAKEYLTTRCTTCDDGNYTTGQISLKLVEGNKTTYTNEKIEKLEAQIKAERERIKNGKSKGETIIAPYKSFNVQL